jgi:hypothetical protein
MRKIAITALLVVAAFLIGRMLSPAPVDGNSENVPSLQQSKPVTDGADVDAQIVQAFHSQQGNLPVESEGTVIKIMADDREGSRHQRFLIRLANGHTLLVAHNIDLAPRVDDLQAGDIIAFKGEYEWNSKGGVIHWTHRDPAGRHPGGWLTHKGRIYQ